MANAVFEAGQRVWHKVLELEAEVMGRMPPNTAPGDEASEPEPVYEVRTVNGALLAGQSDLQPVDTAAPAPEAPAAEPAAETTDAAPAAADAPAASTDAPAAEADAAPAAAPELEASEPAAEPAADESTTTESTEPTAAEPEA